jgi:hypothetical protein
LQILSPCLRGHPCYHDAERMPRLEARQRRRAVRAISVVLAVLCLVMALAFSASQHFELVLFLPVLLYAVLQPSISGRFQATQAARSVGHLALSAVPPRAPPA